MALLVSEVQAIDRLYQNLQSTAADDERLLRYYQGRQRVEQLGMAIPGPMRRFLVIANWCRMVVDRFDHRQQVRALILPGEEKADPTLREIWDANNMDAAFSMFNRDRMIYGRAFLSVGANEENSSLPIIRVESPREMAAEIDVRTEKVTAAARFYGVDPVTKSGPTRVTLFLPDVTVWVERGRDSNRWVEVDRDEHRLGAVPVIMHLNRRLSGGMVGESAMSDVIPLADSAARSLTNLQFAQEAHGAPRMWMAGVTREDFQDKDGKPVPKLEAYFNAVTLLTKENAKVGQLTAADLKNFETALDVYGKQAATITGFPAHYFGLTTVNPATEGAVAGEEATLVRSVEAQNNELGVTLGWAGSLAYRFATGEWINGNRVRCEWFDPSTPTVAQREDALQKRRAAGATSLRGYWTALGWSEARMEQEEAWLAAEANADPMIPAINALKGGALGAGDTGAAEAG